MDDREYRAYEQQRLHAHTLEGLSTLIRESNGTAGIKIACGYMDQLTAQLEAETLKLKRVACRDFGTGEDDASN